MLRLQPRKFRKLNVVTDQYTDFPKVGIENLSLSPFIIQARLVGVGESCTVTQRVPSRRHKYATSMRASFSRTGMEPATMFIL